MAEFKEVMQQIARMCREIHCKECILYNVDNGCMINFSAEWFIETSERIEKEVKEWTTAHTEPVYPSWEAVWNSLFPHAGDVPCPNRWFGEECQKVTDCSECLGMPMSKEVAEKLGIKPVGGGEDADGA